MRLTVCHLCVTEGVCAVVEVVNHWARALASRPQRSLVPALEYFIQQRAVERQTTILGTSVRQNFTICQLLNRIRLTFVSRHSLLFLLPNHSLLLMLLHRPLMIGMVEPIHHPKQFPWCPSVAIAPLLPVIICIHTAVICISVPPAALCHVTFAVNITAIYIGNGGAAASVCSAGWTWVEELVVWNWSASVLLGLEQV